MPVYGHAGTNAEHPAHWRDDHFLLKKCPMLPELELELYVVTEPQSGFSMPDPLQIK